MLTEGEPEEAELSSWSPVPREQSVWRRLLAPRTLVWLGLTAAIAVMITIYDPGRPRHTELADNVEKRSDQPRRPPSMEAAPKDSSVAGQERRLSVDGLLRETSSGGEKSAAFAPAAPALPTYEKRSALASERKQIDADRVAGDGRRDRRRETAEPAVNGMPMTDKTPAAAAAYANSEDSSVRSAKDGSAQDRFAREVESLKTESGGYGGMGGPVSTSPPPAETTRTLAATLLGQPAQGMLVVRCDISSEAARKGSFDKLLAANGIAMEQGAAPLAQAGNMAGAADRMVQSAEGRENANVANADSQGLAAEGQRDLVYVEATHAQVVATLAGLNAQPEVFRSVSVEPEGKSAEDAELRAIVRQQTSGAANKQLSLGVSGRRLDEAAPEQAAEAIGPKLAKPAAAATPTATIGGPDFQAITAPPATQQSPQRAPTSNGNFNFRQAAAVPQEGPQSAPSPPRQQVLFVLRVADGQQAPKSQALHQPEAAKPAEPAVPAPQPLNTPEK